MIAHFFKIRRKSDGLFFLRPENFEEVGSKYRTAKFAQNSWQHYGRFMIDSDVEIVEFKVVEITAIPLYK